MRLDASWILARVCRQMADNNELSENKRDRAHIFNLMLRFQSDNKDEDANL